MAIDAKFFTIGRVASLQGGYPFRGSIEESAEGGTLAVQMKDVDLDRGVNWSGVIRTSLAGRKHPDWLKAGDVLFVSKGARFYAVCIDEPPSAAEVWLELLVVRLPVARSMPRLFCGP